MIAVLVAALFLAPSAAPAGLPAAACPRERLHVVETSSMIYPPDAHPTHERVRFLVDVGSDGRIRRTALAESSGDAAFDAAAAKALAEFRFAAPTSGCVSASSVWSQWWNVPPGELVSPSPVPSPSDAGSPSPPVACEKPFARPERFPLSSRRKAHGTVSVDVALDATARVTSVRLAQSSGNPKTDYAATAAARNGTYVFERQPGCAPAATTYRLELTFR